MSKSNPAIHLILDNVRSTHNVGSIFRTADAAGVSQIYCVGTTPSPIDRFGRKRKDVAKVALGAEDTVGWEHIQNEKVTLTLINKLKKEGFQIVAVEQDEKAVDYQTIGVSKKKRNVRGKNHSNIRKTVFILGNEVGGVSKSLLKVADVIIEIPMKGKKESLNVAVTAGIVLFRLIS